MRPNIGEFLSALRRSKGLTQQEVADRLGVSNKTVSSWETGASYPDISMLSSIAELYGVTCDEILRGERIPPAEPQERTEQRREKNLSRLLAGYRNNASAVAWICAGLYAVTFAAVFAGAVLFWIAAAGVYTVFYVRRRKKFRAAHAAAQQGGGGTMPDEKCRM